MAREGLRLELAAALRKAAQQDEDVVREAVQVRINGGFARVNLRVSGISNPEALRGLLLVAFDAAPEVAPTAPSKKAARPSARKRPTSREAELERELQYITESLRSTIEQLETSNEELKSTNEELHSTNEEMQSANEESETSKEELQSLNEELQTLNSELQGKIEELSQANDDLTNLLNAGDIATIFLDNDLCIRRFTQQATEIIRLIHSDVGRPLADIVSELDYDPLEQDARNVLQTLSFKEVEVRHKGGAWFIMRIMPYRTASNAIDGLVLTFVNIDRVKQAETRAAEAREKLKTASAIRERDGAQRHLDAIVRDSNDAVTVLRLDGRIVAWNRGAERMYGWSEKEALTMYLQDIVPQERRQGALEMIKQAASTETRKELETSRLTKDGCVLDVLLRITVLTDDYGSVVALATTERQVTRPSASREL